MRVSGDGCERLLAVEIYKNVNVCVRVRACVCSRNAGEI